MDLPPFALGIWLPWNGITVLEETELPSLALAPTQYIAVRNHMLKKWHDDPRTFLTLEAASANAPSVFDDPVRADPPQLPREEFPTTPDACGHKHAQTHAYLLAYLHTLTRALSPC